MPLDPTAVQAMQQIAKFKPDQLDGMMRDLATKSPEEWRQGVNLILMTLWAEHAATRRRVVKILELLQGAVAAQTGDANGAGVEAPMVGGDGAPITDPAQLEAERIMNASAGARGAVPPGPAPKPRPAAAGRAPAAPMQPRVGGDGAPITDPAQLEAEALMDDVVGPR